QSDEKGRSDVVENRPEFHRLTHASGTVPQRLPAMSAGGGRFFPRHGVLTPPDELAERAGAAARAPEAGGEGGAGRVANGPEDGTTVCQNGLTMQGVVAGCCPRCP